LNSRSIDSYLHSSLNKFYSINIIITVMIILMGCVKKSSYESKDDFDVIITVLVVLNLVSLNSNKMLIVTAAHSSNSPSSVRILVICVRSEVFAEM